MELRATEPQRKGNVRTLTGNDVPNNMLAVLHKLIHTPKAVAKLHIPYIMYVNTDIF